MKFSDRIINKFYRLISIPKAVLRINGRNFRIPRFIYHNFYKANYESEKWLTQIFFQIHTSKPIHTIIDVGVNIGQTLLKIKSIDPDIKYIGFEPNPFCCTATQQIILQNDLSHVSLIPCGLSNKNQLLKLSLSSWDNWMDSTASLIKDFRPSHEGSALQNVMVSVLDDIWDQLPFDHIDIIKIDIEGGELEAFIGMQGTIKQFKPIIIIEVLPAYNSENEFRIQRQLKLASLIAKAGYKILHIKNKLGKIKFQLVSDFPVHKNVEESDYILLPADMNEERLGII